MTRRIVLDGVEVDVSDDDVRAKQIISQNETSNTFALYKTDIESRMTDDELTAFDAALSAATVRQRRLWTDCQMVYSDDPFFATLTAQLTAAFGADRAAAILARSVA